MIRQHFRILPVDATCTYYIKPVMTYSAYDATNSVISIPYDGTTEYEYSTDGKNTWKAVTGTIDCKTLNLEFDNAKVEGKALWLRPQGSLCSDATSETAIHMLKPTIEASTPQEFKGVQNTAFTGLFTINLSDIWTGTGGGVTVTSSNSEIAATLSPLSGSSTSYTGEATITLNMAAKPAGDYHTTLTISSVGAATQTVNVTIHILSLAVQEFDGGDHDWFYVDGFFCGNAGTDYGIATTPTIYLSYALYKDGDIFSDSWESAGTFTMYDMTSGTSATSGWHTEGNNVDASGQLKLELNQSYFTNAHTYKLVWENTANLTNDKGLQYANCEMSFIYTDNCDAPTALPA